MIQSFEIERALQTWRKILKIEDELNLNDDHSELILKVAARLTRLGYYISEHDITSYQKKEQQAKFLLTSLKLVNAAKEAKFLIPIQADGKGYPVFGFPDLLLYCNIGYYLNRSQPFYSIEKSCYETDAEIVKHYLSEIRKVRPHGPYCLIGYCRWGKIAMDMANELLAEGEEVPVVILIEYYSSKALTSRTSKSFIDSKARFLINTFKKQKTVNDKLQYVFMELFYAVKYIFKRLKQTLIKEEEAPTKKYPGKVVLIRASEAYGVKDDPFMGWRDSLTGEVECYKVKGDHLNIMLDQSARQIAVIMNQVFAKINFKNNSPFKIVKSQFDSKLYKIG